MVSNLGHSDEKKPAAQSVPARPKTSSAAENVVPASGQQTMLAKSESADQEDNYDEEDEGVALGNKFLWFSAVPSWMTSMVVHIAAVLVLAFLTFSPPLKKLRSEIVVNDPEEIEVMDDFEEKELPKLEIKPVEMPDDVVSEVVEETAPDPIEIPDINPASPGEPLDPINWLSHLGPSDFLITDIGPGTHTGFDGRDPNARRRLGPPSGATGPSETAVQRALEWFANHQNADGSWDFDHQGGPCQGRCANPGTLAGNGKLGATAMALLPFLGNGNTHQRGEYKDNVQAGLYYLVSHMKVEGQRGSLMDGGNMYSHGLATIALCEAYGMTNDRGLRDPAQLAINHIVYAQDPVGGGWRYRARTAGDTSVVGWQLMALKSAHMAYLHVPEETIRGTIRFLDSVQSGDYGSRYGYTGPGARTANTSIGLLSRMYLGWKHDHPGLQDGVEFLDRTGPSTGDMYYNYYATQVMRHYDGDEWTRWNEGENGEVGMRDQLVNSQAMEGHARGSWHQGGDLGSTRGGRHYVTSMSCMILEVYYRHQPLYQQQAAEDDFQL